MLKTILSFITALLPMLVRIITRIVKRNKPALKAEEVLGEPETQTYTEAAQARARADAEAKFGPEDKAG